MTELDILQELEQDPMFFSESALQVFDKQTGVFVPFVYNEAQRLIHNRLENQKKKSGYVRAVVVKGRQQGCSTLVAGRYFHRALFVPYSQVFVIAHRFDSTQNLYRMARRFYDTLPQPLKSKLLKDNAQDFVLSNNSAYAAGTAGSSEVGRGTTISLCHCSEVAFWPNGQAIAIGLMQAVPEAPGTEIILESTAIGPGDFFHSRAMSAAENTDLVTGELKDPRDYQLIFSPWFFQKEYRRSNDFGATPTAEEEVLLGQYGSQGLTFEHLLWRRAKLKEILVGGDQDAALTKFRRDYPNCLEEAFLGNMNGFFPQEFIRQSVAGYHDFVKSQQIDSGVCTIGVDPARNRDRTVLAVRRGKRITRILRYDSMDEMRLAGIIARLIEDENPDAVFVDVGYGYGTIDRLNELGFGKVVKGVAFGESALNKQVWRNKRAEMHGEFRDWLENGGLIPDDKNLLDEMYNMPFEKEGSSGTGKFLVSKDDVKDLIGRSPDTLDAVVLNFAYPVRSRGEKEETRIRRERKMATNARKDPMTAFMGRR